MKKTKAVLFDHDGTLVDSERTHCNHWQRILQRYNVELSTENYIAHHSGVPNEENANRLIRIYNLAVPAIKLVKEKEKETAQYLEHFHHPLMHGAREVLTNLQENGYRLAIVSGASRAEVTHTIQAHHLGGIFDTISTGDDVQYSKPSPDVYLNALKQLKLSTEQCIAIEDSYNGLKAATAAGIKSYGIRTSFSCGADFSIASGSIDALDKVIELLP